MSQHSLESPRIARDVQESTRSLAPRASILDTLAITAEVFLPTLAKGVIIRRPAMLRVAEYLDLDRRAVRRMQRVRNKYGAGPLLLRFPGRTLAIVLDPAHVHRILGETPEPFATDTAEKHAALAHFEPKNVLISRGPERQDRRRYHEQVLDSHRPAHRLGERFVAVVQSEARYLLRRLPVGAELTWDRFSNAWSRVVRRVVFGDAARNDTEISEMMAQLRSAANWAFLRPQRAGLRSSCLVVSGNTSRAPNPTAWQLSWHIPSWGPRLRRSNKCRSGFLPSIRRAWRHSGRWHCWHHTMVPPAARPICVPRCWSRFDCGPLLH